MALSFQFDFSQMDAAVQTLVRENDAVRVKILREIGKTVTRGAKNNAPVDEGYLTQGISWAISEDRKAVLVYIAANDPAAPYAIAMHESEYQLGPNSQAKAAKGFRVGNKYITRAFEDDREKIITIINDQYRKALQST